MPHPDPVAASFTCPVCSMTSYNPVDVAEGYCGACHDWTAMHGRLPEGGIWAVMCSECSVLGGHSDTCPRRLLAFGDDPEFTQASADGSKEFTAAYLEQLRDEQP